MIGVVDEVVVNVVGVVSVVDKGKVFCDPWDDWWWICVEEEETEVVLDGDVKVVGDGLVQAIEGNVIFLSSWIWVFAVVMSKA